MELNMFKRVLLTLSLTLLAPLLACAQESASFDRIFNFRFVRVPGKTGAF